jgi:hypothetical protein
MQSLRPAVSLAPGAGGPGRTGAAERLAPGQAASAAPPSSATAAAPPRLRRGLSNWDHQLQGEIAGAQHALDFLEQSAAQLQAIKIELAGTLSARRASDSQLDARLRQFSQGWRAHQAASGGTGDDSPAIAPERWSAAGAPASRQTLHDVVQALGHVKRAHDSASQALAAASKRVASIQPPDTGAGMERLAQDFAASANQPGYDSLLSITSALSGISRERTLSLLRLR